jgi:hypothetical protein
MAFPVEPIPDHDRLFRHVPNRPEDFWVPEQNRPSSAAFKAEKERSDGRFRASVDWQKYKTVEECRRPNSMAIVAVTPVQCRSIGKDAEHTPICAAIINRAHSDICDPVGRPMTKGQNSVASVKLAECAVVVWPADGVVIVGS